MTHTVEGELLTFFDEWENEAIETWLKERGLEWDQPTVCGSCCGFYSEEYWVRWGKPRADPKDFNIFAADKGIDAHANGGGIWIGAKTT